MAYQSKPRREVTKTMPKKPSNQVVCEFFKWNLFRRGGVFYADGRMNQPNLGKTLPRMP